MEKKKILKIVIPCGAVALVAGICLGYLCSYMKAQNVDEFLKDSATVKVIKNKKDYLFDGPGTNDLLVFYPGAKVDEKAYAPLAYSLAAAGFDTYIAKMPLHFAIFDVNKADDVISSYKYDNYYVGGHSLGGAMAANYVSKTKANIKGLVFFAAYTTIDLSNRDDLNVFSIYGMNDEVINTRKIVDGRHLVPKSYLEVPVEGGNHAQFGRYGKQRGDGEATITGDEQIAITVTELTSWKASI